SCWNAIRVSIRSVFVSRTSIAGSASCRTSTTIPRSRARASWSVSRWPGSRPARNEENPMSFLQVSRKVDYALRAVIHLANEEASARACSVAEIAARERIPRQFLEKIVQQLIHTGLVRSRRGPHGGYGPGRPGKPQSLRLGNLPRG